MSEIGRHTVTDWNSATFFSWPGLRIIEADKGRSRVELEVREHHRGGGGTRAINGGIVAYMFDGLLGIAIASLWDEKVQGQVTVNLNVDYLGPVEAKERIEGTASVVRMGRSVAFAEGRVFDEVGNLCATCTGIYRLFRNSRTSNSEMLDEE